MLYCCVSFYVHLVRLVKENKLKCMEYAISKYSLQVFPTISTSSSVLLLQLLFWSSSSKLSFGVLTQSLFIAEGFFLSLSLIHFLRLICTATGFFCAFLHSSSMEMKLGCKIFKILLKGTFTSVSASLLCFSS